MRCSGGGDRSSADAAVTELGRCPADDVSFRPVARCSGMGRDLTSGEWSLLEPHLPPSGGRGGRWSEHHMVVTGSCSVPVGGPALGTHRRHRRHPAPRPGRATRLGTGTRRGDRPHVKDNGQSVSRADGLDDADTHITDLRGDRDPLLVDVDHVDRPPGHRRGPSEPRQARARKGTVAWTPRPRTPAQPVRGFIRVLLSRPGDLVRPPERWRPPSPRQRLEDRGGRPRSARCPSGRTATG